MLLQWEVLETIGFTSQRRRMSVVVRNVQTKEVVVFSKGADDRLLPLVSEGA